MATATRWAQVVDAILDGLFAGGGFRAPGADGTEDLPLLLDGPELELTGDGGGTYLVIGGTLDVDGEDHGTAGQAVATLGTANRSRQDTGAVICQAVAQYGAVELAGWTVTGDSQLRVLRGDAFALVDAVDTWLRANPDLGLISPAGVPRMVAGIGDRIVPRQYQTQDGGAVVSVEFTVTYTTRV